MYFIEIVGLTVYKGVFMLPSCCQIAVFQEPGYEIIAFTALRPQEDRNKPIEEP